MWTCIALVEVALLSLFHIRYVLLACFSCEAMNKRVPDMGLHVLPLKHREMPAHHRQKDFSVTIHLDAAASLPAVAAS